jgi:poly(3-hydroxybutyrate) depolymerase
MSTRRSTPTFALRPTLLSATVALAALVVGRGAVAAVQDPAPPQEPPPAAETQPESSPAPADTLRLKERDHDELAKLVADYFEAVGESKGVLEATDALQKKLASIAKRDKLESLLPLAADWERVLSMARSFPANPQGKGRDKDFTFTGVYGDEITYMLHGPKAYKNSEPTPLLIIVPDKDQKIDEILRQEWLEKGTGIEDEMILVCTKMPANLSDWTSLGSKGKPGGVDRILQVYKEVGKNWNVDPERVFVCGVEDGVAAAVRVAALFPDRFAGVIGRSGDPKDAEIRNFSNLPMLLAAGSDNAKAMADAAEKAGWKHIENPPSAQTSDIVTWMRAQRRTAHPVKVQLGPLEQFARDAYWLRAEGFETDKPEKPWVEAVVDRATNTITIDGSGVSRVVVFYSDRFIDLDRPVKVVIGGVTHEHRLERGLEFMLDRARSSGDPGRAYVAQRPYDFPAQ